ncbi:MAG: peroxidase family protein, partial [Bacteroidia bacterium]|nr:peroxidase family protein [Bacteroidia bacterium]
MRTYLLAFGVLILSYTFSFAQEVRSFDGYNNHINNPEWGATGTLLERFVLPAYADGISMPAGADRMNPRAISNRLFSQESSILDTRNLSDFIWVFGQFIDHDIILVEESHTEPIMISVPEGDPMFDPAGSGNVLIPMMRSLPAPGTGTDVNNPRTPANAITAYIDGSAVYGSDDVRASWLRTYQDGKLKMSEDNQLPYNTLTGTFNSRLDANAPGMANANPFNDKLYVAGDVRANENLLLTAYHTLFVREHNRMCDEINNENPGWDDEQIYQHARRHVAGFIQNIVYREWLPAMGIYLEDYTGYNPNINPGISDVFSAAAYRMGHT